MGEPLLTAGEVARFFGVDKATVTRLSAAPDGLPCIRIGGRALRYRPSDVRAFMERRMRNGARTTRSARMLSKATKPTT